MTANRLADDLRQILTDLDHGPLSGPLRPITRERLVALIANVQRLGDQPAELEATATGRDPEREQAIRSDALNAAVMVLGDVAGTTVGVANHAIDLAELFATWIRHGARP
jgi:hypothetical protein